MKKLVILFFLFVSGCVTYDTKIAWQQIDDACVYTEELGRTESSITGKRVFYVQRTRTVMYPDMKCTKIIEGELLAGINKQDFFGDNKKQEQ